MTCIIGLVNNDRVYIGGDSAGVSDYNMQIRSDRKVFRNGDFLIGFTSSFRMGQLLRYQFKPPTHPENMDHMEYMVSLFVEEVRKCLSAGGFNKKTNERDTGGSFLVGYRKHLYEIDDDYQVGQTFDNIAAVGCGSAIALGAMHAISSKIVADKRIIKALAITEKLNSGVRGPFVVDYI